MKISDKITQIDDLKPNKYSYVAKLGWINQVDGFIWNEIYKYTGFSDVMRLTGVAAYALPVGVDFSLVTGVYVDGEPIYPITYEEFETTGYYRGLDGKLNIYPVPTADDTTAGLRIVHRLPFVPHTEDTEEVYVPVPYDTVYDDYCFAMIDKFDRDMEGYNNNTVFYDNGMKVYADFWAKSKGDK